MVEGGSSKAFTKIKKMVFPEPATLHLLLDKLADSVIDYLNAQVKAGAQSLMVFDTWGGAFSLRLCCFAAVHGKDRQWFNS